MPATFDPSTSTLLIIDVQRGFNHPTHWGASRSNPNFETNIVRVLNLFRAHPSSKIIHVAHHSSSPDSILHPSNEEAVKFQPYVTPRDNELVITKDVNSAFIGTNLEKVLRQSGCKTLVIAGLTTDHCVSTTTRMAANLKVTREGGRVILIGDATAAHEKGGFDAETIHAVQLASLNKEFAEVITTDELEKMVEEE